MIDLLSRHGNYKTPVRLRAGISLPTCLAVCRPFLKTSCYLHGCPCGFYADTSRECRCTPGIIQRYLGKISGPLLDRIDIHIEVPAVAYKELRGKDDGVTSAEIRGRVIEARRIQHSRGHYNAYIP